MIGVSTELALLLAGISLLAGIGITAVGPGGIFVTVALYALTPLAPAEVAGTALATFIVTGAVGTLIYGRSGELRLPGAASLALLLGVTATVGALAGAQLNLLMPPALFGYLLSAFTLVIGAIVIYRAVRGFEDADRLTGTSSHQRIMRIAVTGVATGTLCGLLGVGGPVVAVPVLVILGVPMLVAVAVAQVQSIFLAGAATFSYAAAGAVLLPMAVLVGVPQLIGVVIGWRVAQRVDQLRLRIVLGVVLVVLGPVLLL